MSRLSRGGKPTTRAPEDRHWLWFAAILVTGVAVRLALSSGYGLGDDPNYFVSYDQIYRTGTWQTDRAYDFRFAFWIPVVASMKLLGPGEAGFIGFVTLCSFWNLVVIHGLARQEWDGPSALLAMALLAVFPLDVLSSTLFVIDIPLAAYCFTALWLYRAALRGRATASRVGFAVAGGLVLFLAYSTKQWAVLVGALFAAEALRDPHRTRISTAWCAGAFLLCVAAYFGWQWMRFGDPIYDVRLVRSVAIFEPHDRWNQLDYARMLWLPTEYGSWFAGWYPHLVLLLAAIFAVRVRRAGRWLAYFLLLLVLLTAAPAHRAGGRWVILVPHIFRYLCLLSIPLCLALAGYLREVIAWRPRVGAVLVAGVLVLSAVQAVALTRPTRDAFGEMRHAVALLARYPDERVWVDYGLGYRFTQMGPLDASRRYAPVRSEVPAARWREFQGARDGIVVTGGARLPWYGCPRCTANVQGFPLPASWTLLAQLDAPLTPYRAEPLRIWRVSDVPIKATQVLGALSTWPQQMGVLHALIEKAEYPLAIEIGKRMALTATQPQLDEILSLTASACVHAGKLDCARELLARRFDVAPTAAAARAIIAELVSAGGTYETMRTAHQMAQAYRERFPSEPDLGMQEISSGFAEAVALYHADRVPEAVAMFRRLARQADLAAELRQKASYFLGLALLRNGGVAEASRVVEGYRAQYGVDQSWTELRYREAAALQAAQPERAREMYGEVIALDPQGVWAREARRQAALLPPLPGP